MIDPIVEEVRKARDAYAARFNYDLGAMVADLRKQEKCSGQNAVNVERHEETAMPAVGTKELPPVATAAK